MTTWHEKRTENYTACQRVADSTAREIEDMQSDLDRIEAKLDRALAVIAAGDRS